ncbi:olfactory receptor 10A7-like [Pleurodeles waltl]|uniref:olfactory receptor 10A7-like n=1 Tax=Pleurodeles waltl TaxID=8319 RepID=UPI0037095E30
MRAGALSVKEEQLVVMLDQKNTEETVKQLAISAFLTILSGAEREEQTAAGDTREPSHLPGGTLLHQVMEMARVAGERAPAFTNEELENLVDGVLSLYAKLYSWPDVQMTSSSNGTWENHTSVKDFILFGFSNLPFRLQICLFVLFLCVYLFTLAGNIMIIIVVTLESVLHTPMYFFLKNLSFLELCYISVTVPKMLVNFIAEDKSISFAGCTVQMYCFFTLGVTECFLLAMMAYDRYVAICNPLTYAIIMNKSKCLQLAASSWVGGNLISLGQTASIFSLPYCGPNVIEHFFCDIPPVLKLACTDTTPNKISVSVTGFLVLPMPFLLVLYSYARIVSAILKIRSAEGRKKVFSTCASHFISVTLFFGTGGFTYVRVKTTGSSEDNDMLLSLLYSVVTPLLNPMIYSLRNKEVKGALWRVLDRNILSKRI